MEALKHMISTVLFVMKMRAIRGRRNEKVGGGLNNNSYNNEGANMSQRV